MVLSQINDGATIITHKNTQDGWGWVGIGETGGSGKRTGDGWAANERTANSSTEYIIATVI